MLKEHIASLYKHDFSNHDYDKYYFGLRYLGNRYLLSKLADLNLEGKRILDIGSGRLILFSFLSRGGSSLVAFDLPEVFEHLNFSPIFMLNEIRRILKDKGYLILTTPNVHSFENKMKFFLNKNIYGNCDKYLKSSPFDYHWREFEKRELFYILKQCDFKVIKSYYCNDILYIKYNSYLYKNFLQKVKAYLKKILYILSFLLPGLKKQIILFAAKN